MNEPAQVTPDGEVFKGDVWADEVTLPTHFLNPDGSTGDAIDWSGSTFTARSAQVPGEIVVTVDGNTLVLSLTAEQTAAVGASFRWYLKETPVLNATWLYRIVKAGAVW